MNGPTKNLVIIDTNILIGAAKDRKLPGWLLAMAGHEKKDSVVFVLPRTVVMELGHKRDGAIKEEEDNHLKASKLLASVGAEVDMTRVDYRKDFLIVDELRGAGFNVRVEEPTFEDYQEAHRRSCLHLFPIGEEDKDSSRDLVILAIALRLVGTNPNTVLVANDDLFHKPSSDSSDAADSRLARVRSLQSIFTLVSPDSIQTAHLIQKFTPMLKKANLIPFNEADMVWKSLDIASIIKDDSGIAYVKAFIELVERPKGPKQKVVVFAADVEVRLDKSHNEYVLQFELDGKQHEYKQPAPDTSTRHQAAMTELRDIIGGIL